MFNTPRHLHFARLADLLENQLPPERETATRQHLQECPECASTWLQLNQVVELMRADQTADAPRDVVAFAIGLFRQRPAPKSLLQRLRAALAFDSRQTPAFGLRSGSAAGAARQLLFSAPGYDVEIQVVNGKEGISLAGQVLGAEDCAGGRVELANATTQASALINESSEFRLTTVPPGHYALLLKFAMRFSYLERVRVRVERSSPG